MMEKLVSASICILLRKSAENVRQGGYDLQQLWSAGELVTLSERAKTLLT